MFIETLNGYMMVNSCLQKMGFCYTYVDFS